MSATRRPGTSGCPGPGPAGRATRQAACPAGLAPTPVKQQPGRCATQVRSPSRLQTCAGSALRPPRASASAHVNTGRRSRGRWADRRVCRCQGSARTCLRKRTVNFRVGIFLDFASSPTRTPRGVYVRRATRNRIGPHWVGVERPTTGTWRGRKGAPQAPPHRWGTW